MSLALRTKDQSDPMMAGYAAGIAGQALAQVVRDMPPKERWKLAKAVAAPVNTSNQQPTAQTGWFDRIRSAARMLWADPNAFFPPGNPLPQQAPDDAKPRKYDYPFWYNVQIMPRAYESLTFDVLRCIADSYDLIRIIIETAKNQLAFQDWDIAPSDDDNKNIKAGTKDRIKFLVKFFSSPRGPDSRTTFGEWLKELLEDFYCIDAMSLYIERTLSGDIYGLRPIDGATLCLKLDYHGETPSAPGMPAYQQVIKGLPAIDYTTDEIVYMPFTRRPHRAYGYSVIEQILMTINIGLRREQYQLEFYRHGANTPYIILTPPEWNMEQIEGAQAYYNSQFVDNMANRWRAMMLPNGCKPMEGKQIDLKDDYDDWLIRLCCYVVGVDRSQLDKVMNRAAATHAGEQSEAEGLEPTTRFLEEKLTRIIQRDFGYEDCAFKFGNRRSLRQEVTKSIQNLVNCGVMTINEGREIYGLDALEGGDQSVLTPNAQPMQFDEVNKLSDLNEQKKQATQFQQDTARASLANNAANGSGGSNGGSPGGKGPGNSKPGGPNNGAGGGKGTANKPTQKASRTMALPRAALRRRGPKPRARTATTTAAHKSEARVKRLRSVLADAFKKQGKKVAASIIAARSKHQTQKALGITPELDLTDSISFALQKKAGEDDPQALMREGWGVYFDPVREILEEAALEQANNILAQASIDPDSLETWDSVNESLVNLAGANSARMLGMVFDEDTGELTPNPDPEWAVSDDVRDTVSDLVANAEAGDWSNADLADAIENSASFSPERADLVARTELKNIDSEAAYQAASGAGATQMQWNLSGDHEDEDDCDDNAEASPIDIGDDWPAGEPAVHPRCQCTVTYLWPSESDQEEE